VIFGVGGGIIHFLVIKHPTVFAKTHTSEWYSISIAKKKRPEEAYQNYAKCHLDGSLEPKVN
jgi:hypothetical protein